MDEQQIVQFNCAQARKFDERPPDFCKPNLGRRTPKAIFVAPQRFRPRDSPAFLDDTDQAELCQFLDLIPDRFARTLLRNHRTATIDFGLTHGDELIKLEEDLYIQAREHGTQRVQRTLSATNATGARNSELELVCDEPPSREPVRRLKGILEFRDVDLEGGGDDVQPARRKDPPDPIQVPADGNGLSVGGSCSTE